MIRIENLIKKFGKYTAVDIDALEIASGCVAGLVGNNGAGKTTLLRLILDLYKADNGRVFVSGNNVAIDEEWKKHTGSFIDSSFLIDFLTPEEYFHFIGDCYGLSKDEVDRRLERFAGLMNGEILGKGKILRSLSAGNRQKTGIIGAMLAAPSLLILDEPFNFLDPSSQMELVRLLQEESRQQGTTMILSSHNLDNIGECSTRILLMEQGKILYDLANNDSAALEQVKTYFAGQRQSGGNSSYDMRQTIK